MQKRTQNDIWKNLYQFPLVETECLTEAEDLLKLPIFANKNFILKQISPVYKHVLSHQIIRARFLTIEIGDEFQGEAEGFVKTPIARLDSFPIPRLIEIFLDKNLEN